MIKGHRIKIVAMILACVLLDIFLHIVTTSYSTMPENASFSLVVSIIGTEITASLRALFAFSSVTFVYLNSRNEIPGEGVKKGLRYGTAIALLWLVAMLEGVSLFGNPIINEFVVGLSDATPVFVLSILLSKLQTEKAESDRPVTFSLRKRIKVVSIYTGIFLAGRYIAYFLGVIQSGTQTRPLETFMWTLLMGISIGTAFVLLVNNRNERSLKHRAMKFGLLIFGLNWVAFLIFMPLIFSGYIADVFLRIIIDTTLVTISSYLTIIPGGKLIIKQNLKQA
ncbi:MAG: hypothetical protein ACOX4L_00080 [Bacillota bacterium]|jgi:hypothetical protein